MKRRAFVLGLPSLGLAACGAQNVWAPDTAVQSVAFTGSGPKALTLYTMKNVGSDNGAHTSLLVDASQRVMFDPAGTFGHPTIPERNDVLFGMTPQVEAYYVSYHARSTYYVVSQKIEVPEATADLALGLVMSNGAVPKAMCARATSSLLGRLPGFESISTTFFPNNLSAEFGRLPGVETSEFRENDSDDKSVAAAQIDAAIRAAQ